VSHGTNRSPACGPGPDRRRARPGRPRPARHPHHPRLRLRQAGCRCHPDPPRLHGPYAEWTRKIGGKTITRRLTPAQLAEYQPLFDNARKLRALLAELQDLTLEIIETDSSRQIPEPETHGPENVG
jgi:hypothetical protein